MIIDVFQDTVCPWCRIGKARLMDAIRQWEGGPVAIRYRTFFLEPRMPREGLPFRPYLEAAKGGPAVVDAMIRHVADAGALAGITFRFDRVKMMPNTRASHTLIKLVPAEQASEIVDAIYRAYFEEGRDIGDWKVLAELAAEQGIAPEVLLTSLQTDAKRAEIEEDLRLAAEMDIHAVPFFVIDGKLALSGAHPAESFLKAFRQVSAMKDQE